MRITTLLVFAAGFASITCQAGVITLGDMDCLNQGCYGASDPTAGAAQQGLTPGTITLATTAFGHGYPFSPAAGDFPGTDTIYIGSVQTGAHDGYSVAAGRVNGPQVLTLDYSSLLTPGQTLATLTLGIAADDFQFPAFGQPFTASVNGTVNAALTTQLNAFNQGGPLVQYFSLGLNPAIDPGNHILTLAIDNGGDGGDGWAVDFLTVGVTTTTSALAEPTSLTMLAIGLGIVVIATLLRPRRS